MKIKIRPELLDQIREDNNLTTDQALAEHLGLAQSTLSGIRNGATPRLPVIIKILDAAGVTNINDGITRHPDTRHTRPAA